MIVIIDEQSINSFLNHIIIGFSQFLWIIGIWGFIIGISMCLSSICTVVIITEISPVHYENIGPISSSTRGKVFHDNFDIYTKWGTEGIFLILFSILIMGISWGLSLL